MWIEKKRRTRTQPRALSPSVVKKGRRMPQGSLKRKVSVRRKTGSCDGSKTKGRKCFKREEVINCITAETLKKMETENYLLNLAT